MKPLTMPIIAEAYEIIKNRERWTQGFYQRDKDGNHCPWAEGYSFCALGALTYCGDGDSFRSRCAIQRISEELFGTNIQTVNDDNQVSPEQAHNNVLRVYETALKRWKDREPTDQELFTVRGVYVGGPLA